MSSGLPLHSRCCRLPGKGLPVICALLLCLLMAACETLENRLTRNQALFQDLPLAHQSLIREGRVQVGFTPSEVYLAWGAPTHKAITENAQGRQEAWYYTTTQTDTVYREERYYDRQLNSWRFVDRPHHRAHEALLQEAVFSEGALSSFTIYPSAQPFLLNEPHHRPPSRN